MLFEKKHSLNTHSDLKLNDSFPFYLDKEDVLFFLFWTRKLTHGLQTGSLPIGMSKRLGIESTTLEGRLDVQREINNGVISRRTDEVSSLTIN